MPANTINRRVGFAGSKPVQPLPALTGIRIILGLGPSIFLSVMKITNHQADTFAKFKLLSKKSELRHSRAGGNPDARHPNICLINAS
ncbi:hypothetical protein, partial [Neisseria dentiae]